MVINKDFKRKRKEDSRLPPGQVETMKFPVLSFGPVPKVPKDKWELKVYGLVENPVKFTWNELLKLPQVNVVKDIHCVTRWSKFDTKWRGIPVDEIMKIVRPKPNAKFIIAYSYDGYSTNLPVEDVMNEKAMIATEYDGKDITSEHGGPARLLVPHLYFWKSAKWVKAIEFTDKNKPGFWEARGYHIYGDPEKEQRFAGD